MCVSFPPYCLQTDRLEIYMFCSISWFHINLRTKNTQMQVNKQDTLRVIESPSDRKSRPNVSNRSFFPVALWSEGRLWRPKNLEQKVCHIQLILCPPWCHVTMVTRQTAQSNTIYTTINQQYRKSKISGKITWETMNFTYLCEFTGARRFHVYRNRSFINNIW